jgi:hypothetical protein
MPQVIDLDFAGTAADGASMYAPPLVAGVSRSIIEHPQETLEAASFCLRGPAWPALLAQFSISPVSNAETTQ